MSRRLNREDLKGTNPILGLPEEEHDHHIFRWRVYEHYEIIEDGDTAYIQAVGREDQEEENLKYSKIYNPLTDAPYLFLDFARIVEDRDPVQRLFVWFEEYGLLGLTPKHARWPFPARFYDATGGPGDTFEAIWAQAYEANESLNLYEATLTRDQTKLERTLDPDPERSQLFERIAEATGAGWIDVLIHAALIQILEYTMGGLQFAYPYFGFPLLDDTRLLTTNDLTKSWVARNLWGAISLQFYWFVTSARELAYCKQCGKIISYPPPMSSNGEARQPRTDKVFCDYRCRQKHHYQNRVKPARQRKRRY